MKNPFFLQIVFLHVAGHAKMKTLPQGESAETVKNKRAQQRGRVSHTHATKWSFVDRTTERTFKLVLRRNTFRERERLPMPQVHTHPRPHASTRTQNAQTEQQ